MKTKDVVFASIIAALYVVLTIGLAPISYGPIQFRVSEFLKFFALFTPWTGLGIAMGDIISGLNSPFVGPWELVFMPITDAAGAVAVYYLFKLARRAEWAKYPLMALYAITTGASVGVMLYAFGIDLFWPLFVSVSASELIILLVSIPIGNTIAKPLLARNILE
jgi:uncharacterized membrane protein